jgi:hypothetical protein
MKKILPFVLLIAGLNFVQAQTYLFDVVLDGLQEVPSNVSPGTGSGTMSLDAVTTNLSWNISFTGLVGNYTASHIHGPATPGVNAGVLVTLPLTSGGGSSGSMVGSAIISATVRDHLLNDLTFVNVHSTTFPGGEIRGQITLIPEPSSIALLAIGSAAGLLHWRRRRQ